MKKREIENLVIELILNTRKKTKRALGLVEIGNKIEILRKEFNGSTKRFQRVVRIIQQV